MGCIDSGIHACHITKAGQCDGHAPLMVRWMCTRLKNPDCKMMMMMMTPDFFTQHTIIDIDTLEEVRPTVVSGPALQA